MSPWWLLLLLPLAVAAGAWLYRKQWRDIARFHAAALVILRCAALAGLVFLAFRPSLLWRRILTFPGRVVFLLDDSESMAASDTALTDAEALRWKRLLEGTADGSPQPGHDLAVLLADVEGHVRRFESFAQATDRAADRFWAEAERVSLAIADRFDQFAKQAGSAAGLDAGERRAMDEAVGALPELRSGAQAFFSGNRNPGARAYDAYIRKLQDARKRLFDIQASLDRRALADPKHPLHEAAETVRAQSRLSLLSRSLAGLKPDLSGQLARHGVPCQRLMSGSMAMLADFEPSKLAAVPGMTDILGPLDAMLKEENPFPLAGVVLLSDGRHLAGGSARATARLASQKQVPIHTAGLGVAKEPVDIAILDVVAPPFAVKGSPATFRVRLKTVLPEPAEVRVEVLCNGQAVAGEAVRVGEREQQVCLLTVIPAEMGRFRYTVQVTELKAERLPPRNNRQDVVMNVREEKVRVLLLDWKPRWETRFALNILQRLDYLDLNSIIVVTQKDSKLARGVRKGTWPKDRETLSLYDLVILGDLPNDLLTGEEWAAVRDAVEKGGHTLCVLGDGAGGARPPDASLAEALWPVAAAPISRGAPAPAGSPADEDILARFCVTVTGRLHPVTAAIGSALTAATEEGVPRLLPGTQVLALAEPGGSPLVSARHVGRGKVLLIDHDRLWKRLNPTLLGAHASMYLNLVSWAVDGDRLADESGKPAAHPLADQHVLTTRESLQVWAPGGTTNDIVEALAQGRVIQSARVRLSRPGTALAHAVFEQLPAQDIVVRVKGRGDTARPVLVVEDNPELGFVGRDGALLATLAEESGGQYVDFTEVRQVLPEIPPKERVEKEEHVWRLWDARLVFAFLLLLLTVEWIWRKWVGLV